MGDVIYKVVVRLLSGETFELDVVKWTSSENWMNLICTDGKSYNFPTSNVKWIESTQVQKQRGFGEW